MPMNIRLTALVAVLLTALPACAQTAPVRVAAGSNPLTIPLTRETQQALSPADVLQRFKDGNERFLADRPIERDFLGQIRLTSGGQFPMATVLGCIDSRVPHEIIFDKGVGDLFSARIAGNFINTDMLGSLEFSTAVAGAKLIIVLGHTECGAVKGACDNVQLGNLTSTLSNIAPAVYAVTDVEGPRTSANKAFVDAVAHENVDQTVNNIVGRSTIIRGLVESGNLIVIGAMHDVSTGRVTFDEADAVTAASLARR